jgi:integrase
MKKDSTNVKWRDGRWVVSFAHALPGEFVDEARRVHRLRFVRHVMAVGSSKAEAEAWLAAKKHRVEMARLGVQLPDENNDKPRPTFQEFAEKVMARMVGRHGELRAKTKKGAANCLRSLLRSKLFKGKLLSEITTDAVAAYHTERGKAMKPSANAELGFLKTVFRQAVELDLVKRNPAASVHRFPLDQNRLRVLTAKERELLFTAAPPDLVPLLRLLLTTGMRPHEAFSLRWEFDGWDAEKRLEAAILLLDRARIFIPRHVAKNHKDREVLLSPELVEMFRAMRKASDAPKVFPWQDTPPSFVRAVRAAKLKNVTLYTLKHTCASDWINKDRIDIVTVSELLGHSSVQMTMRYCHSNETSKREAVEKASLRVFKSAPVADAPAVATRPDPQTEGMVS